MLKTDQLKDELNPSPPHVRTTFHPPSPTYCPTADHFHRPGSAMLFLYCLVLFFPTLLTEFGGSVSAQCHPCPCPNSPQPNPTSSPCCPFPAQPPAPSRPCCPSSPPQFPQSQSSSSCCMPSPSPSPFPSSFPSYPTQPFMPAPPQAPPARIPMPSYQIAPPEYSRAVPLPVPIPAKERFSAHEPSKQKSGEDIKDPFEKEAKPSRDESFLPSKYVTGPGSDALLPPIIYPTASAPRQPIVSQQSNSYYQTPTSYQQQQQFQQQQFQQPQDRLPFFPGNSCQCNQPRPSPPQPFAGPQVQMPMQNCCIGCSQRQCSMKMKNKAFGLRTLLNNNNNNSTTANSVEWKDGSGEFEGDEGRCNDAKLRKILKENSSLKMAAAKEIILKRAEKLGKPEKKWRRWGVHVFCAPKDLEYVTRTDRFCSGGVADGVCFAFRTEID